MKTNYLAVMAIFAQLYTNQVFAGNSDHDHGRNGPHVSERSKADKANSDSPSSTQNQSLSGDEQKQSSESREIGSVHETGESEKTSNNHSVHRSEFGGGMLRNK